MLGMYGIVKVRETKLGFSTQGKKCHGQKIPKSDPTMTSSCFNHVEKCFQNNKKEQDL